MPSEHYMIEAKLLLGCASDDIPRADEIRTVIKDIWDIRTTKMRSSVIDLIENHGSYAGVDHLTIMEINSIRPILPHTLDQMYRIKAVSFFQENFNIYIHNAISHFLFLIQLTIYLNLKNSKVKIKIYEEHYSEKYSKTFSCDIYCF